MVLSLQSEEQVKREGEMRRERARDEEGKSER